MSCDAVEYSEAREIMCEIWARNKKENWRYTMPSDVVIVCATVSTSVTGGCGRKHLRGYVASRPSTRV